VYRSGKKEAHCSKRQHSIGESGQGEKKEKSLFNKANPNPRKNQGNTEQGEKRFLGEGSTSREIVLGERETWPPQVNDNVQPVLIKNVSCKQQTNAGSSTYRKFQHRSKVSREGERRSRAGKEGGRECMRIGGEKNRRNQQDKREKRRQKTQRNRHVSKRGRRAPELDFRQG